MRERLEAHILCILHHFTYFVYNSGNFFFLAFAFGFLLAAQKFPSLCYLLLTGRADGKEAKRKSFLLVLCKFAKLLPYFIFGK